MLPSVSAGSAALTKYAKAIAAAAPDQAAQDGDTTPRTEQEAARHNADPRTAPVADSGALAREARETVQQILEMMRVRVLTALLDLDVPHADATTAAQTAASQLANAIAVDGRHAAEIVHALLERSLTASTDPAESLLLMTARNLTVIVDHETGDIRIELPTAKVKPVARPVSGTDSLHLIDFTDRSPTQAAPALAALGAVQETARDAGVFISSETAPGRPQSSNLLVAPSVFGEAVADRLSVLVRDGSVAPDIAVRDIAAAVSRIATATFAGAPDITKIPVAELVSSLSRLEVVSPVPTGDTGAGKIVLNHGHVSLVADSGSGAVTVRIGQRVTAFAPASLSNPATAHSPLPQLDVLPLPIHDIPASLPVGKVVETPGGLPFVPPEISDLPAPGSPSTPSPRP